MRSFPNFRFIFLGVLAFLAVAALGAVLFSPPRVFANPASDSARRAPNPRQAMIEALAASYPHPSLGEEGRTFDRLVGTWDCDFAFHLEDGRTLHKKGELRFGWILNGRAVQDIWITYPADSTKERTAGTSVRFFDTALRKWRVVFVGPQVNYLVTVQGGLEGDRIVLHGVDTDGAQIRWSFMDIAADSFTWHGEKSRDGGKTWVLEEEHHMRRRTT
jgi:hypothetical protein